MFADPVQGLLAVGTELGRVYVFGGPEVQLSWNMGRPIRIKHLAFRAGSGFLCCVGECSAPAGRKKWKTGVDVAVQTRRTRSPSTTCRAWRTGSPCGTPLTSFAHPLRASFACFHLAPALTRATNSCVEPSASHSFMFLGGKDGTVEVYDIDRGCVAIEARIPNLWHTHEDIQRQSGIADAPHERHVCVLFQYFFVCERTNDFSSPPSHLAPSAPTSKPTPST